MLPTSKTRLYANVNANINEILPKEKAISMSKSMAKFYKKPKSEPLPVHVPVPLSLPESIEERQDSHSSSKKENIKNQYHYQKQKQQKQQKQQNSEISKELNYIGEKEDLNNLDFLFREATGYEVGEDKDKDKDKDEDEDIETDEGEKGEKGEKHPKILYPFSHKYSSHFSQDYKDDDDDEEDANDILVEFLIYKIGKNAYKPFLEFMLYKSDNVFYLPNLMCNRGDGSNRDNIYEKVVTTLDTIIIDGVYKIKGRLIPSNHMNNIDETFLSERYILFVEYILDDTESEEGEEGNTSIQHIPEKTKLWWATISEIFNYKKVIFYPIHDSVVNLFYSYPDIMNIYMGNNLLEIPIVVYNGNNDKYTKYNAIFSLKKSPQFSRYGPFYYFTDLHSSFKYACYDIEGDMQKFEKGGLLRTIIFPRKIKMFLERDKIDGSAMAHYLFEKYPEKINTGQFRDNDTKWVFKYNTAYNGEYMISYDRDKFVRGSQHYENDDKTENKDNIEKLPFPVMFCVSNYNHQHVISYHYVDTKNIPDKYSYKFKDYRLL
jgi:hypothetical protein